MGTPSTGSVTAFSLPRTNETSPSDSDLFDVTQGHGAMTGDAP